MGTGMFDVSWPVYSMDLTHMSPKSVTALALEAPATPEKDFFLTFDQTLDCRLDTEKTCVGCVGLRGE